MQYSYNIIVDSPCEITADFAKANQLKVLHFTYTEGNGDEGLCGVDDLFVSRTAHEFYEAMRNGAAPQTSQPSQHEFESAFREAIESGIPAVYLAFDSGISGCYEGACMALDRLKDEYGAENVAVHIVDTKLPATPLNMLVWEAVRQREKGMPLEQMIAWATEAHNYMHIHFMVDDLKALARGGRIPSGVAVVGTKLDIKPMLTVSLDGKLELNGIAHGRKKGIRRMAENYLSLHDPQVAVCSIGNADCYEDVEKLEKAINKHSETPAFFLESSCGPTIGCHVGPGFLSCCFWGAGRRKEASPAKYLSDSMQLGV